MASLEGLDKEDAIRILSLPLLSSLQIGALVTWGLQGVLCVQFYTYYSSFPNDRLYMKVLAFGFTALEIVQTCFVSHDAWSIFAQGFGSLNELDKLRFLWFTLPILGGIAGFVCHLTFAYRIYLLSQSKIAAVAISLIAVAAAVTACIFGAKMLQSGVYSNAINAKHIYLTCGIWNGAGAVCDAVIALCMTYYLSKKTGTFRTTDILITKIIRLSIEAGIVTATASIASAALFVGFRQRLTISVYFIIPAIMITKLYAITILATFNNRCAQVGPASGNGTDIESCSDNKQFSRAIDKSGTEIRIGRTVVQQVWQDEVPMSHLKMDEDDSIKDIDPSKKQKSLTP